MRNERKEELKDEMKNRISLALKDPILQQGFEIICKENAELKEYNKYLKRKRQGGIQKQYNKVAIIKRQNDQLTKAKNLLSRFIELKNKPCAVGHSVNMLLYENISAEAEQFLNSEVEK